MNRKLEQRLRYEKGAKRALREYFDSPQLNLDRFYPHIAMFAVKQIAGESDYELQQILAHLIAEIYRIKL